MYKSRLGQNQFSKILDIAPVQPVILFVLAFLMLRHSRKKKLTTPKIWGIMY